MFFLSASRVATSHEHICLNSSRTGRERERKGGLFSNTGIATAFTQNEAHEKGRRPPPALPVTLTPDTVPLVSQRAVDAIAVVFGVGCILDLFLFIYLFLARCGVSPVTQT